MHNMKNISDSIREIKFRKVVHAMFFFENHIALSKRLKDGFHKGFWQDVGGKVEDGESLMQAIQRETIEETGLYVHPSHFELQDCFIYLERGIKTFLFKVDGEKVGYLFRDMKNTEPHKHSDWQLFTKNEALKLKLLPSVRHFLESL